MDAPATVLTSKFDRFAPETMMDPYPVYERLRKSGPVCRGGPGEWVVTRYTDVAALLRDARLGHQFIDRYQTFTPTEPVTTFFQSIIFERDEPRHQRLRQLLGRAFHPALMQHLSGRIHDLVNELIDAAFDRGSFDAVTDFAQPLPARVVGELIGIPVQDLDQFHQFAAQLSNAFDMRNPPNQNRDEANQALVWLRLYLRDLVTARRRRPGSDLVSQMLTTQLPAQDRLTDEEIIDNSIFVFFSGLETTKDLIAIGCACLLKFPVELERLRRDRSLVGSAVEEFLRYDAPIQALARLVREPMEIGGRRIKAGRVLVLLLGSANHDEDQFPRPSRMDVGRCPNQHVSFGGGSHYCLGAVLTRSTAGIAFEQLLARTTSFEAASPPVRFPNSAFRSYQSIPIRLKAL
jgi:cytochrome P450